MSLTTVVNTARTALSADPHQANATFEANSRLVGPTEVAVRVGSGHSFAVDEPEALGGANAAANPVEYALAALGSCQAITYQVWAAQLGVRLDKVEIGIDGDIDLRGFFGIDDGVRPGFNTVRIRVSLSGPESDARYKELAAAVDAHCPVLDLFRNPVPVHRELVSAI
jgi:uncharacterized OsmC-like protein